MADPKLRNVKIKTGVVKRLAKEKNMYKQEVIKQEEMIEKMKAEGRDTYDIRKQTEVLVESQNMVPDIQRRLKTAYEDLTLLLQETESGLSESEEYKLATELLKTVQLED